VVVVIHIFVFIFTSRSMKILCFRIDKWKQIAPPSFVIILFKLWKLPEHKHILKIYEKQI